MKTDVVTLRGSLTQETLRLMQRECDTWAHRPFTVMLAREICKRYGANDPSSESAAVWAWVRENVAYRLDPVGAEWVQDPFETLVISRAGDCDDMAAAAGALLQAIGHPCRMAAVKWEGYADFSHAVCIDKLTGAVVDPVSSTFQPWPSHGVAVSAMLEA